MSDTDRVVERVARTFVQDAHGCEPFGHGHINETYLVHASSDLVLQRVNERVFADPSAVVGNVLTLHEHIGSEVVPEPVATSDGRWLVMDGGAWRAWKRVAGAAPFAGLDPTAAASAAELLGRFHASVAGMDPSRLAETLPRFHDIPHRLEELRTTVAADPCGRVRLVRDLVTRTFEAAALAAHATRLQHAVPRRVAHNDAKLDNFLFRNGRAVRLVDLDTLMPGQWLWDVGDLVRSAASRGAEDDPEATIDEKACESILTAYRGAVGGVATATEAQAIDVAGAIVTYEQAVRFLTDWLAGDVYYRTSRSDQNLDRARAQFSLLATMPGTVRSS